ARARWTHWDGSVFHRAILALPGGPWHPDDRAFFDKALRYAETQDPEIIGLCSLVMKARPAEDDLPILDRLRRLAPAEQGREQVRGVTPGVRRALGLPGLADEEEGAPSPPRRGGEWMDERDE